MPRPMSSMVSVAMKAGTRRIVTSTPLIRPITRAEEQADHDRGERAQVEEGRRERHGEDDGDQAEGRADGEIQILVDDDEGHADRHHGVARGVAEQGVKGVGRAEESGIDEAAAEIEQPIRTSRPTSQPPTSSDGGRRLRAPVSEVIRRDGVSPRARQSCGRAPALPHMAGTIAPAQFSNRLPTAPTVSLVTSWARVSRLAAAMPRSICR